MQFNTQSHLRLQLAAVTVTLVTWFFKLYDVSQHRIYPRAVELDHIDPLHLRP